jgi:hypothetical protein
MATDVVFQASDLAGARRREFLSAARDGRALLRDTDGFALAMVPLADLEAVSEIGQAALTLLRAESGLRRADAHASDLGPLAWLLVFDEDDRAQFVEELSDAITLADATRDPQPLRTCLRDWRTTAEALSDPARRLVLIGVPDEDFVEVERPA